MSGTGTKIACSLSEKPLTYSSKKDSATTIKQIKVLDQTGKNLGCW